MKIDYSAPDMEQINFEVESCCIATSGVSQVETSIKYGSISDEENW